MFWIHKLFLADKYSQRAKAVWINSALFDEDYE